MKQERLRKGGGFGRSGGGLGVPEMVTGFSVCTYQVLWLDMVVLLPFLVGLHSLQRAL